jgi:hypothetical protein
MAKRTKECKSDEKTLTSDNLDVTTINGIVETLLSLFSMAKEPASQLPPALNLIGAKLKPGMSGRNLAADIITEMESELGIPMTDDATFGEPNSAAGAVFSMANNMVSHIQENASVQGVLGPASINITATGANGGGPIVVNGTNLGLTSFNSSVL